MKFRDLINESESRPLNKPLTDSEIKQLNAYNKRMKNGKKVNGQLVYGKDTLRDHEIKKYNNLIARKDVLQKKYELKTLAQIKKMSRGRKYALEAIAKIATGKTRAKVNFIDKTENLQENDYVSFIKEYKDKIIKMYKSSNFKKLIVEILEEDIKENNYNMEIPDVIRTWAINIIKKDKNVSNIVFYDGYKLYQDINYDKSVNSWTSSQGASMTNTKALASFSYYNKEYKKEFDLNISGYWN